MKKSLRWRFTIPFAVFIILAAAGLSIFFSITFSKTYQDFTRENLVSQANLLVAELSQIDKGELPNEDIQSLVERVASNMGVRVTIINPDGSVTADSDSDASTMDNHLTRPEVQQALAGETGFQKRYSKTLRTDLFYIAVAQVVGDKVVRIVRVSEPMSAISITLRKTNQLILISAVLVILLFSFLAYIVSKRTIKPIIELTNAANRFSNRDFSHLPISDSNNELGVLSKAFSSMALQIQDQWGTINLEKQMISGILEKMMDGIVICSEDGKIQMINPAARNMFDIHIENFDGYSLVEAIQYYQVVELLRKTLDTGKPQNITIDLKANKKYLIGMSTLLEVAESKSILLLFQDLTQQRGLEKIRQEFVGNVSHELRTPLASLQALTETLQNGALDDLPKAKHFLSRMEVEIEKLTQLVLELLDLSRIESGRVPLKRELIDVNSLLRSPVERMMPQAERAGISLNLECSRELPKISVDVERMEQVLVNLIHNAIKFTPAGGSIILSAEETPGNMILQIKDSGTGISEEDLPRIFERFYKTDYARSSGGTGLGLSISKHVVEAHGGKIWVASRPGLGSTFLISIPLPILHKN